MPLEMRLRFRTGEALEHEGSTVDLGMGGAFVQTRHLPSIGESVVVLLTSPTAWDPLELGGKVRWVHDGLAGKERGFGVKFDPIEPSRARALYELLQANSFIDENGES